MKGAGEIMAIHRANILARYWEAHQILEDTDGEYHDEVEKDEAKRTLAVIKRRLTQLRNKNES